MPNLPPEVAARRTGILYSLVAYTLWGLFPLYFKAIQAPPIEVLAHRVLWSALTLGLLLGVQRRLSRLFTAVRAPGVLLRGLLSGGLLAANWFIYIWAVAQGRVVDASLGYFITPLVSVAIGVLVLGERLRAAQRLALGLAAAGVAWLTLQFGELPWVGLALALTFGTYGALRKTGALGSLDGLMLEQALLLPLAVGFIVWQTHTGASALSQGGLGLGVLLASMGPISALPLGLFAAGARLIPLSLVGLLQYVAPTLQLLLGLIVWQEPFNQTKLVGYALIWLALITYSLEGMRSARLQRSAKLPGAAG